MRKVKKSTKQPEEKVSSLEVEIILLLLTNYELMKKYPDQKTMAVGSVGRLMKSNATRFVRI